MKAAVLGSPIAHSKSPLLHLAAYAELGLDWAYDRHEVGAGALGPFLREHVGEYKGLSLTMPLKNEAFSLAEHKDAAAYATNACNTLVFDGAIRGFNTDVRGFIEALRHHGRGSATSVCIVGTGATARSAAVAMLQDGVRDLVVMGRRREAIDAFVQWFRGIGGSLTGYEWSERLPAVELTISTVPSGAADALQMASGTGALFDVVYAPWPTKLAEQWTSAHLPVISGLDLLVHQAAEQVLLMTGTAEGQRPRIVAAMYGALRTAA